MEISKESWDKVVADLDSIRKDVQAERLEISNLKLVVYGNPELGIIGLQALMKSMDIKLDGLEKSIASIVDNRKFVITMIGLVISMLGSVGALTGVIFMLIQNAQRIIGP